PFGTDKLRLYYNDIPVTNGSGFSTIETYDLENLGQIEVIIGPKGTAYGANLGGAILLKTKENKFESTSLSNNFTLGSFSLLKNNLSFDHRDNSFAFGLQYGHLETDGFRENNSFDRDGILLNTSYRFNAKNAIAFLLNYVDYTAQIPSSLSRTDFDENPRRAAANWLAAQGFESNKYTLVGASYTHSFSSRLENTSSIYYTYLDQYEARPFNIVDQFTNGYGFRTRFSGNLTLGQKSTRYSLGTELYHDEFNGDTFINRFRENNGNGSLLGNRIGNTKEFRRQLNIFGTFSISLTSNFNVQAGLNINATHYDFRDRFNSGLEDTSAERDFSTIVLPSLSLTYNLSKGNIIYGNISRGFSNPGFEETLTPDGALNPEISQETGTNYELGTRILSIENRLRITMAIYRMDINNLLVAQRIEEDQFIGRNAGSTRHQGLEFDMNLIIPISTKL
ncbi:MAG: TonB-dependent receptor, partial [Bacteroidota bacterium]